MRIPRLFVHNKITSHTSLSLDETASRYLSRVLRLGVGQDLTIFDGTGKDYHASIGEVARTRVTLQVTDALILPLTHTRTVNLIQGLGKGEKMDYVVQKAVELGVSNIQPLVTEFSVVRLAGIRAEKRVRHWRQIAIHACEQSGRNTLPSISDICNFNDWLKTLSPNDDLNLTLAPDGPQSLATLPSPPGAINLIIGPEGGLSKPEMAALREHGFIPVRLGPRILRTETAAAAALTATQLLWGDMR